jgi:hypothetical protein
LDKHTHQYADPTNLRISVMYWTLWPLRTAAKTAVSRPAAEALARSRKLLGHVDADRAATGTNATGGHQQIPPGTANGCHGYIPGSARKRTHELTSPCFLPRTVIHI